MSQTQSGDEVEVDGVLQQAEHAMAAGMQKVGQQAICTTTDRAADALDANAEVLSFRAR
jgi:hypothetical protein